MILRFSFAAADVLLTMQKDVLLKCFCKFGESKKNLPYA